jgi:glucose/mannose-6-phosphate isomerase
MNLNDTKQIKKLDKDKVAESISLLPAQVDDAYKQLERIKIPASYRRIDRVVVNGMGGSNLGARIIASVFKKESKIPILIEPGYDVPGFVDENTLYIISSYSGNTEEPLSVYAEAKKRGAKIAALTAHGAENKLEKLMAKENLPGLVFSSARNPSGQPRLGLGYGLIFILGILASAGVLDFKSESICKIIAALGKNDRRLNPAAAAAKNPAKKIAEEIFGREAVLVGGNFLEGSLHAWRNQFCENSKNFAQYLVLPELNHYSLESLGNPPGNRKNLAFIFLASDLYRPRLQKRLKLTMEIVRKNRIKAVVYKLKGETKLTQALELLQLGSWATFYLAMLNDVNPALIPWVDWFKKKLA